MRASRILCWGVTVCLPLFVQADPPGSGSKDLPPATLLQPMSEELTYSMGHLVNKDGTKPYFLSYTVTDSRSATLQGTLGALYPSEDEHQRTLDVDVRVGDYTLD